MAVMETNNFEKNVQESMDGFKIPPSDSVWNNVEKKIAKKKKDKRMILIFFFLILFLLSGGFWLFNSIKNNTKFQNNQLSNVLKKESKTTNNNDSYLDKAIISSGNTTQKENSANVSKEKIKSLSTIINNKKGVSVINSKLANKSAKRAISDKNRIVSPFQNEILSNKKSIENENNTVNPNNLAEKNSVHGNVKEKNANPDSGIIARNKMNADTSLKNKGGKLITIENSPVKKISNKMQKRKWTFGITFSGGTSIIGEEPLGMNNTVYPYALSALGPGLVNNPGYSPSKIKGSAAFIGGIFIEKNISARSKISLGISYKYYSLLNEVGSRIDSNFASYLGFYSPTNNVKTYRNNFHYLEIPISIKFQLFKSKTLPVYWDAGINISQLISSNALQFTSNPGLYYNDNSLFNKTQIGLQTGFSIILFSSTKNPVNIGPYFIYNASKLANEGLYDKKHFSFVGIRTEILFEKK